MNVGRYLRGEDRHVGTARVTKLGTNMTPQKRLQQLAAAEDYHSSKGYRLGTQAEYEAFAAKRQHSTPYNPDVRELHNCVNQEPINQPALVKVLAYPQTPMQIKPTHQIAYDYCMSMITQRAYEDQFNKTLQMINPDNQIFGLADAVEGPYTNLVHQLLGPDLFDWLMWWMYETNCGQTNMLFEIDGTSYDPTQMTLYKFLETVDAS